jgi:hypothetical protein
MPEAGRARREVLTTFYSDGEDTSCSKSSRSRPISPPIDRGTAGRGVGPLPRVHARCGAPMITVEKLAAFLLAHADLVADLIEAMDAGASKEDIRAAIRAAKVATSDRAMKEELGLK